MEEIVKHSIKSVYKDFASRCPALCKNSIVAGGAIRDSLLGEEVKDVDIFIPWNGLAAIERNSIGHYLSRNMEFAGDTEGYDTDAKNAIGVYNFKAQPKGTLPIQVITYPDKDYESIIKKFPVSLSRVYFDPMQDKIVKSEVFKHGLTLNKVYYKPAETDADSKYITKIYNKYRDRNYTWVAV